MYLHKICQSLTFVSVYFSFFRILKSIRLGDCYKYSSSTLLTFDTFSLNRLLISFFFAQMADPKRFEFIYIFCTKGIVMEQI